MTKDEALKLALEALEYIENNYMSLPKVGIEAITSLRQAIEQAEKQGQWGASSVTKPEYVAEQKEKTQRALDLMAENARELGLDYEPVQAEKQEPVAKKRMLEWAEYLKRKSDNGHYMNIPSEMSSGECWELAKELEQFINTTPQPQEFVCSTGLCHFTLTQTNVGIGERGMEAYEAAKERGWVGLSDERLMEMPKQEPVAKAWDEGYRAGVNDERMSEANIGIAGFNAKVEPARNNPYRTTPQPQREWVGLTDEEIWETPTLSEFARAIEAKLKERNT
jgi:hypothetical protein